MKIILSLLTLVVLLPSNLTGQDIIYRSNQTNVKARILNWTQSRVKYVKWEDADTSVRYIGTSVLDSIVFSNGKVERFQSSTSVRGYKPFITGKNYLGVGIVDPLLYGNLRLVYERYLENSFSSVYIPVTIGISDKTGKSGYAERAICRSSA